MKMTLADGQNLHCYGKGKFNLEINDTLVEQTVWVADISSDGILGYDFLKSHECQLDFKENEIYLNLLPDSPYTEDEKLHSQSTTCARVALNETLTIPPESETLVKAHFVETPESNVAGIIEPTMRFTHTQPLLLARILVDSSNEEITLRVLNPDIEQVKLYKNMVVAEFEPVDVIGPVPKCQNAPRCNVISSKVSDPSQENLPEHLKDLWEQSSQELNEVQKEKLQRLLLKCANLFAKNKLDLGYTEIIMHEINTGDAAPIKQAPRRIPIHQREIEKQQVQALLDQGIVEESTSPWASNCVMVLKKDKQTYRYVLDFRKLNSVTVPDSYGLSRIDDTLDRLSGAKWFSTLDLQSGYWQVGLHPNSREKTAFHTSEHGLLQFKVLPMGLVSATATFSRLMQKILRGLQWQTCLVYLDDIMCYGVDFDQAIERLDTVFLRLKDAGLKLNPKKCSLLKKKVSYLGHCVSEEGVSTDPEKISAVKDWPTPKNVTDVLSFLATCSYYRKYIKSFGEIARPLYLLTEHNRVFEWSERAEVAFQILKEKLISSPILAYPNEKDKFILDCDASGTGLGSVLSQNQEGHERVISYFTKTLNKAERNYCVTRRELLAIIVSVKHFHHYL